MNKWNVCVEFGLLRPEMNFIVRSHSVFDAIVDAVKFLPPMDESLINVMTIKATKVSSHAN